MEAMRESMAALLDAGLFGSAQTLVRLDPLPVSSLPSTPRCSEALLLGFIPESAVLPPGHPSYFADVRGELGLASAISRASARLGG
jgi:hypothetical protein